MAKRFFFVSAGILCLAAAYHLGVLSAQAGFSQANALGIQAISQGTHAEMNVLLSSGDIVMIDGSGFRLPETTLPVPPSEIFAFECSGMEGDYLGYGTLITTSGIAYRTGSYGTWWEVGPVPGVTPVTAEDSSFGSIKGRYHGE
jgi:hypothetical protein